MSEDTTQTQPAEDENLPPIANQAPAAVYPSTLTPQGTLPPARTNRPTDFVSLATPQGMPGVASLSGKTEVIDFMGFDPLYSGTEAWNTPNVYTFAGRHWQDGDEAPVEYIPHLRDAVARVHPHLNPWGREEGTPEAPEPGPRTGQEQLPHPMVHETLNRLVGGEANRHAITQSVAEYSGTNADTPRGIPHAYPPGVTDETDETEPDETDNTPPPSSGGRTRTRNRNATSAGS